jgi:hypothetical protein
VQATNIANDRIVVSSMDYQETSSPIYAGSSSAKETKNDSPNNISERVQQILIISNEMKPSCVVARSRTSNKSIVCEGGDIDEKEKDDEKIRHDGRPSLSSYLEAARDEASTQQQEGENANPTRKDLACVASSSPLSNTTTDSSNGDPCKDRKRPTVRKWKSLEIDCRRNDIPRELSFHRNNPKTSSFFRSFSDSHSAKDEKLGDDNNDKNSRQRKMDVSNRSMLLDDVDAAMNYLDNRHDLDDEIDDKSTGSMPSLVSFLGNSFRSQTSSVASAISNKSSACSSAGVEYDSFSTIPSINTMKTFASNESGTPTVKHRNYVPGVTTPKKEKRWESGG